MTSININQCSSADDFLNSIRRSNDIWWNSDSTSSPWFFRGVGDHVNWRLIPSAWRKTGNKLQPLIENIKSSSLQIPYDAGNEPVVRTYYEWHAAEQEALHQFSALANEIGFNIDSRAYESIRSPLQLGFASLIRGQGMSPDDEIMALAQHHGIPTRLLDWSANPVIAAFFAASTAFRPEDSKSICVWALDTSKLHNERGQLTPFGRFRVLTHRPARGKNIFLHSQAGMLTELLGTDEHFFQKMEWPALEDVFQSVQLPEPILIGHTLEAEHVPRLLKLLDREGINNAVLMPTLDNVAKTVLSRWQ